MLPSLFLMAGPRGYRSQSRLYIPVFGSPTTLGVRLSDKTIEAGRGAVICRKLGWRQRRYIADSQSPGLLSPKPAPLSPTPLSPPMPLKNVA